MQYAQCRVNITHSTFIGFPVSRIKIQSLSDKRNILYFNNFYLHTSYFSTCQPLDLSYAGMMNDFDSRNHHIKFMILSRNHDFDPHMCQAIKKLFRLSH